MLRKLILGLMGLCASFGVALTSAPATAAPAVAATVATSSQVDTPRVARQETFWCAGTFRVISTRTFGPSNWKVQVGLRNDGARAIRVYHPSGRWDRYRFSYRSSGQIRTTSASHTNAACAYYGYPESIRAEANNGYGWHEGPWISE